MKYIIIYNYTHTCRPLHCISVTTIVANFSNFFSLWLPLKGDVLFFTSLYNNKVIVSTLFLFVSPQMRPVQYKDFQAALQIIRPSVSAQDLQLYIQWNQQFGCGKR